MNETRLEQDRGEEEIPESLEELFLELFPSEFLDSLPPGYIDQVIENLAFLESLGEPLPNEWAAMKKLLQQRGFLK